MIHGTIAENEYQRKAGNKRKDKMEFSAKRLRKYYKNVSRNIASPGNLSKIQILTSKTY